WVQYPTNTVGPGPAPSTPLPHSHGRPPALQKKWAIGHTCCETITCAPARRRGGTATITDMTSDPSRHVPPSERPDPHPDSTVTGRWRALARTPLRVIRGWVAPRPADRSAAPPSTTPPSARKRSPGSRSTGVFRAAEGEDAHLGPHPPFGSA